MRRAAKRDKSEAAIVKALEAAGAFVYRLTQPVDLAVLFRGRVYMIEVKTPGADLKRKDRESQRAFCKAWDIPLVATPQEALIAIGAIIKGKVDYPPVTMLFNAGASCPTVTLIAPQEC